MPDMIAENRFKILVRGVGTLHVLMRNNAIFIEEQNVWILRVGGLYISTGDPKEAIIVYKYTSILTEPWVLGWSKWGHMDRSRWIYNLEVQESLKRGKQHLLLWQYKPKCYVGHNVFRNGW